MRSHDKTTFERRIELLFYLMKKQGRKVAYIANEFDVCRMTVYRDIDFLSRYAPLYIKRGGVYISDKYKPEMFIQLSEEEEILLRKILNERTDEREIQLINRLIMRYSMSDLCKCSS